jgi:hypothetical protein
MPRGRPRKTCDPATIAAAADCAKSYADHWEQEARANPKDKESTALAKLKAGHWRILEKEIRGMNGKPLSGKRGEP